MEKALWICKHVFKISREEAALRDELILMC